MCNLSIGVWEQGFQQGLFNIVIKMLKKAMPTEEIMEFTDLTLEQIEEIAQDNGLELVKE